MRREILRAGAVAVAVLSLLPQPASAAARWSAPVRITPPLGDVPYLTVALDRRGAAAAVGLAQHPARNGAPQPFRMVGYQSRARGPFGLEQTLFPGNVWPADIVFDRRGAAVAIADGEQGVTVATATPGRRFGALQTLDPRGNSVRLAAAPTGEVFAFWSSAHGGRGALWRAVRPAAGSEFGPSRRVSGPDADAGGPEVAFDRAGNALALWEEFARTAGGHVLRLAYSLRPAGGDFGPAHSLAPGVDRYAFASNDRGRVAVVWQLKDGPRREVRGAVGEVRAGIGRGRRLDAPHAGTVSVAVGSNGSAIAAWRSDEYRAHGSLASVRVATSGPKGPFGAARRVFDGQANLITAFAGGGGTLGAAWRKRGRGQVYAADRTRGQRFGTRQIGGRGAHEITAGATARGRAVVAWQRAPGHGGKRVRAAVARRGGRLGRAVTVARINRRYDIYAGPGFSADGEGGAFVWWSVAGTVPGRCCHSVQVYSGSYLYP